MSGRTFTLVAVATVIGVIGLLTIVLAVDEGISARVVVSLVILALFGFGVVGALRNPPDE
jgi:VIT1/CCC1 family predicted Fe2+/Mn2+ transporter